MSSDSDSVSSSDSGSGSGRSGDEGSGQLAGEGEIQKLVSEKPTRQVHRSHIASNKYVIVLSQGTCATHDNSGNSRLN